jgi:hypothetical protein
MQRISKIECAAICVAAVLFLGSARVASARPIGVTHLFLALTPVVRQSAN